MFMDNYDLSNLLLFADWADTRERHSGLTAAHNRRATFSGRSVTVSRPEQTELQQPSLTYEEQLALEQTAIADFDIALLSNIPDIATLNEFKDPFAVLAAYQPPTFDDHSEHPPGSELGLGSGLLKGLTAEDLTDIVKAEPEGNDVVEQSEQSQGEFNAAGISIPESAIPDTVSDKRSGKRRAPEPEPSIKESIDRHFNDSLRRSARLSQKKQKFGTDDTESLPLPRGTGITSQSAAMPEKSADSQKNTEQNPEESLKERVKKETAKWVIRLERGVGRRFVCNYPNCGSTCITLVNLRMHIFKHIGISVYKCPYPECSNNPYFRDTNALRRHERSQHTNERPYPCELCSQRFGRLDTYKKHKRSIHLTGL